MTLKESVASNLISKFGFTDQQITEVVSIPPTTLQKLRKKLGVPDIGDIYQKTHTFPNDATLSDKILYGMNLVLKRLVIESAQRNESLVIGDISGTSKPVSAKELLKKGI